MIIQNWCRLYSAPDDITSLLIMFSKFSRIYSTAYSGHGHGNEYEKRQCFGWKEITKLSNKNIKKINVGMCYSLYLGADGAVYKCESNFKDADNVITEIECFKNENIEIIDIATEKIIHCV